MAAWLQRGDCQKEAQIISRLVEMGHDTLEIAATALKMARGEEKQRPIAPISEIREDRPARARPEIRRGRIEIKHGTITNDRKIAKSPSETGMVRLTLNAGKAQGVRPGDVVSTITYYAKFPGNAIGAISILDKHTLVDVPQRYVEQALAKTGKYRIRKSAVTLELA
jgi:ATP-dependent RNA helicase DeaD